MTQTLMPIERYDDWEKRLDRQDAFWDCEIIDRAVVTITCPSPNLAYPAPAEREWDSHRQRWLDAEYQADRAVASVMNRHYAGDALPQAWPNLGPEVFSAYFGQEMEYGEATSWSIPNLPDYSLADTLQFSDQNAYWTQTLRMTDALLEAGKGLFYTGITDLHPGGDAVAAFRDPMHFAMDMLDSPAEAKALSNRMSREFCTLYDRFMDRLESAGQACCSWPGPVSRRRWHTPSNDFSCMVSKDVFDDVFLPGISEECRHLEASLYHLDGPQALTHLDSLLEIPDLSAIQWVYGAGNGCASDWIDVYKKIRAAGKGIQVGLRPDELDLFMDEFSPEGLWLGIDADSAAHAADLVKRVEQWT